MRMNQSNLALLFGSAALAALVFGAAPARGIDPIQGFTMGDMAYGTYVAYQQDEPSDEALEEAEARALEAQERAREARERARETESEAQAQMEAAREQGAAPTAWRSRPGGPRSTILRDPGTVWQERTVAEPPPPAATRGSRRRRVGRESRFAPAPRPG